MSNEAVLSGDDIRYNIEMLSHEADMSVVFTTPDGKRFRAHNVVKPGSGNEILVSLIAEENI